MTENPSDFDFLSAIKIDSEFEIIHPQPQHFVAIQDLCKKVYPFSKPWNLEQLEAHHAYFPQGQLIITKKKSGKVVGLAFSLIISWDDYSPQDNWRDFTSGGFFHNHNPKKGRTLYGAEIMVDPEYRCLGLGKALYQARQEIVKKFKLKRIRAGARLRGYSQYKSQMTPEEYTQQVIQEKIFDSTLSFQLKQGFVVLDVAKNYLSSDPESLGFAALIEYLNPDMATARDLKKQKDTVESFLSHQKMVIEHLPRELRRLVRKLSQLLGATVREYEGDVFYDRIESYRQLLKKTRQQKIERPFSDLVETLRIESKNDRFKIAHAFSLLLELINVCESAYRTWRQRQNPTYTSFSDKIEMVYVLTAHPTEARSHTAVEILRLLTQLSLDALNNNFIFRESEIQSQLRLLWLYPLVKTRPPTVLDEAEYIYSILFSQSLSDYILGNQEGYQLKLRSWVGGDKDGHPGVNHRIMKQCLLGSRHHIIAIIENKLKIVLNDIAKLKGVGRDTRDETKRIKLMINGLFHLKEIKPKDGSKITEWKKKYTDFLKTSTQLIRKHYQILLIDRLLELFPALVVPIELRDHAKEISIARTHKTSPIRLMLLELRRISMGSDLIFYAKGLIISHCETAADVSNANELIFNCCKVRNLPCVPLFESRQALMLAPELIAQWLKEKSNLDQVKTEWEGHLEVMLGYSDSSKQVGVLPSRYLIRNAMFEIERSLKRRQIKPIFFHGAGGSVARGGGSLREQISWWPDSGIEIPKLTIQGEMIQRTFATPEILNSQCLHLSNEARLRRVKTAKFDENAVLSEFIFQVEKNYVDFVSNTEILTLCLEATPYNYLHQLKIGSRPSKRPSGAALNGLRAIPWVLCWTQTRLLFPTWWGVGSAWFSQSIEDKKKLKALYISDSFFASFVRILGFTLAKVELNIWELYLNYKHPQVSRDIFLIFKVEFEKTVSFFEELTGSTKLIAHKPWLEESIHLRSPYIHILNILQIISMQDQDEMLLKETLVGVACGMLTTG